MPFVVVPWAAWKTVLLRMYEKRVKISEQTSLLPPCPTRYTCDGTSIHSSSVRALEKRGFVKRTRNNKFKIVWHLTPSGRKAARGLQAGD